MIMPEKKVSRKIELQNNEVEEMLGRVPAWITRNGIVLFLFLLALLIFGSWIIKYPDSNNARIVVTSVNPPANLEARVSGKITRLFVNDNELVSSGDILAMLENPATFDDVKQLKSDLSFIDTMAIVDLSEDMPELRNAQLGTIQTDYSLFLKAYRDYVAFKRLDYHQQKIQLLRSELVKQRELARSLSARAGIAEEEYTLSQRQSNRDADLYIEKVVSESAMEKSHSEMLSKRNSWQEIVSIIAENNISVGRIEEQIVDQELKQQEDGSQNINILEEALNNLNASIASWEHNYLLIALVSGEVTFNKFWSENQNVKAGEIVLTIVPAESGSIVGKIDLPTAGAGKVKKGDQVFIQFDNYPYLQYGMVKGIVDNISQVPEGDYYAVEVLLPNRLRTYYDTDIPFSQNMQGQAEILTEKRRLLQRVLDPIKSAITKQAEM